MLPYLQIVFIILVCIISFILEPIAWAYCYKIWRMRDIPFFKKRLVKLSIFCVLITSVQMKQFIIADLITVFPAMRQRMSADTLKYWRLYTGQMIYVAETIRCCSSSSTTAEASRR